MFPAPQIVLLVQGLSLSSLPIGTTVISRADCVSHCFFNTTCLSFFYDSLNNMCHLSDTVYFQDLLQNQTDSMQYMALSTDRCRAGYSWHRALKLCFKLFNMKRTWDEAERQCVQDGGNLLIDNIPELRVFTNQLVWEQGIEMWVGTRVKNVGGVSVWSSGQGIYWYTIGTSPEYEKGCSAVLPHQGYKWYDNFCSRNFTFVCQVSVLLEPKC